jgi:hypothetical protein
MAINIPNYHKYTNILHINGLHNVPKCETFGMQICILSGNPVVNLERNSFPEVVRLGSFDLSTALLKDRISEGKK